LVDTEVKSQNFKKETKSEDVVLHESIENYMAEHKVGYSDAYDAVIRGDK